MKPLFHSFSILLLMVLARSSFTDTDEAKTKPQVLITDVHVFDGVNEKRIENSKVLVEGNLIKQVSKKTIEAPDATVIDGGGRTLTPGFIDVHTHIIVNEHFEPLIYDRIQVYVGALTTVNAKAMLHRGFTMVRDVGGPSQGLKDVIDKGLIEGPRILLSGAFISQSFGNGDFDPRMSYLSPRFTDQIDKAAKRHPYQKGPLGVIKPGAYADIIIVDGNRLKDIALLGDPEKNLKLIMKDGRIYKNTQ